MNRRPLKNVDIYSDAGRLEAVYREVLDPLGVAVICHPHPLHGGTLHNKVVFRAARGLEAADIATVRFNFRGAGASQGKHDHGEGEQRDFEAALRWIRARHPGMKAIAGGFSFGAWVASRVACDLPEVAGVFLIGTPVDSYDFLYLGRCRKPKLFIHGSNDEHGDAEKLAQRVGTWPDSEMVLVESADHFFSDQLEVVEESLRVWATTVLEG